MFKKVFQSISKALGPSVAAEEKPKAVKPAPQADPPGKASAKEPVGKAPAAKPAPARATTAAKAPPQKSPEELCAIDSKMSKEDIKVRLAMLYKRYNRATSSLDAKLRAESEIMLDAIVTLREKHFGPI